jgi:hypothetical protein
MIVSVIDKAMHDRDLDKLRILRGQYPDHERIDLAIENVLVMLTLDSSDEAMATLRDELGYDI